jgi:hypothetical protein
MKDRLKQIRRDLLVAKARLIGMGSEYESLEYQIDKALNVVEECIEKLS